MILRKAEPTQSPKPKAGLTPLVLKAAILFSLFGAQAAWGQISETDLGSQNPDILVQTLMGSGVTFSNVSYQGVGSSAATFTNGASVAGFNDGIILSTGSASGVVGSGPVTSSTCNFLPGDQDLALLSGNAVTDLYDATTLSFDFVPAFNNITFQYVFASEEYNQYVGSEFNDVFGFYVNGTNAALLPGTTTNVSINNVNDCSNATLFIDNIGSSQGGSCAVNKTPAGLNTPMNGLTTVLTVSAAVTPGVLNHIKLAIADVGDCRNDSNVFIKAYSFVSAFTATSTETSTATETPCGWPGKTCTPTKTWTPSAPTATETPCGWPGNTCTFTSTFTKTPTFTRTSTSTATPKPSSTKTPDIRPTPRPTKTRTPTATPTFTSTETPCGWPGLTCTPTFTPTPTSTFIDVFYVSKNIENPKVDGPVSIYVEYEHFPGDYSLRVFNSAGEQVKTLAHKYVTGPIGESYFWGGMNEQGDPCASGVYIFYLVEPFDRKTKKMILVR